MLGRCAKCATSILLQLFVGTDDDDDRGSKAPEEVGVCGPRCLLRHAEGRYQSHEPDESSETYESMVHLITAPDSRMNEEPNGADDGLGDQSQFGVAVAAAIAAADRIATWR